MKPAALAGMLGVCALLLALPLMARQGGATDKDGLPEVNVVLRISRKLVNELTTKKTERTTPVFFCVDGQPITGLAHTNATATVVFDPDPKVPEFTVVLRGTALSTTVADRPPIQVFGSARLDFVARKHVVFDGNDFRSAPSSIDAQFTSSVDGIATPPGLLGLLIELIATPKVRRSQPRVARAGFETGKAELLAAFDQEVDKALRDLNEASPLEKSMNALFPQTKDWIYYPLTTPTHLIVGAGPPGRRLPVLPTTERTNAQVELWIRNKPETEGMIAVLKLWQFANKKLEDALPPELAKRLDLGKGVQSLTVGEWFVIQIGRGSLKDAKEEPELASAVWRPAAPPGGLSSGGPPGFAWRPAPPEPVLQANHAGPPAERIHMVWRPVLRWQPGD
jgi:hypothetical protein